MPKLKVIHSQECHQEISEFDKDIWDGRKLGADIRASDGYTLNFLPISQLWLREAGKRFIKYTFGTQAWSVCHLRLKAIKRFSSFLAEFYPECVPSDIDRSLTIDFPGYLLTKKLGADTRRNTISGVSIFLTLCSRNNWADVPDNNLFYKEDYPKRLKIVPRYIPQEVVEQLNRHLDSLPQPVMRMVLVLQESGMRVGELCRLRFDCIRQDAQGGWFLQYYQFKMNKDHCIPVSRELVVIIQEQQQYIRDTLGVDFPYLFCAGQRKYEKCEFIPIPKPMSPKMFSRLLNKLALDKNLCTISGKPWRFQAHQFRHTLGTNMINNGVPQHIVQRYLGHESPQMTAVYAHIHDQTLKEEFVKFKDKMVDVTGKVVSYESVAAEIASGSDPNSIDAQWLKKNILAQALPNGLCGLPANQPTCPYGANKCLTGSDGKGCPHFKTDTRYLDKHKEHLARTNEIVEWAQENPGAKRAEEILKVNLPVQQNLGRIVALLESQQITQ